VLGAVGWGGGCGGLAPTPPTPKPQSPIPNPQITSKFNIINTKKF